ncbi:MAG: IPT/TIG domain-containing protein [Candidatus Poribacteria bacterium]|nr:IPT/TIG domain-containing protein [Candidatus Poribacteria bacterium]
MKHLIANRDDGGSSLDTEVYFIGQDIGGKIRTLIERSMRKEEKMKHGIRWFYVGLVILGLSVPMIGNTASIFIVSGQITDANGLPLNGLEVTVSNETKNLTQTKITGDSGRGTYAATFIDLFGGSVADAGDEIKVSVKQEGKIVAEETHTIVQGDFAAQKVNISLQIISQLSLTHIIPDNALASGGATVQIIGENFREGVAVTFGGIDADNVVLVSKTELSVIVPPGSRGVVEVIATNPDSRSASFQFTYIDYPPWDLDKNGAVNIFDLVGVASQFGQTAPGLSGDIDGNGTVNIFDLVLVASHFGEATVASAPPRVALNPKDFGSTRQMSIRSADRDAGLRRRIALTELENLSGTNPQMLLPAQLLRQWLATTGEIPSKSMLLPNYPNPFNPETWIPYYLASSSDVTILVYNVLGQPVRHLEIGFRHAGRYVEHSQAAHWDGRNDAGELVTSGVYFYSIETEEFSAVRKMVIGK